MGAMDLDSLLLLTRQQKPNHCTTTTTTTEGFTTMLSDLCGLFKPCRKEIEV